MITDAGSQVELFFYRLQDRLERIEANLSNKIDAHEQKFELFLEQYNINTNFTSNLLNEIKENLDTLATIRKSISVDKQIVQIELELPCQSSKDICELENQINVNDQMCIELKNRYRKVYDSDVKNIDYESFIKKCLCMIWSTDNALNFSWDQVNHLPVKDWKLIKILRGLYTDFGF